jgi:hypothetical protein
MARVAFQQVDVFTAVPFKGNPVAVVLEGGALSTGAITPSLSGPGRRSGAGRGSPGRCRG